MLGNTFPGPNFSVVLLLLVLLGARKGVGRKMMGVTQTGPWKPLLTFPAVKVWQQASLTAGRRKAAPVLQPGQRRRANNQKVQKE